jgi:hypothetical protein
VRTLILLLLFCCSNLLSAKEVETPYITSERDTLALVDGVINAYNGKLVQIDQDIQIQSSDPLEMTRFYDGGHHFIAEFGYGVGCSYSALLHYFQTNEDKMYAAVELRMGTSTNMIRKAIALLLPIFTLRKQFTNTIYLEGKYR